MRAIATILVALSTAGCAPVGIELVPRQTSGSSLVTPRWVGTESSQSSVSASYDRLWLDRLVFEVEVVNQSDSTLVVDPAQFSLTLSSSTGDPPRERVLHIAPDSPARVKWRIDRESVVAPGLGDAVAGLAGIALATVVVATIMQGGEYPDLESTPVEPLPDPWAMRRAAASRMAERLGETLLHRTELAPRQQVRGELWFPARALRRVLGPRSVEVPDREWSITQSVDRRRDAPCAITLRAPDALGGQEIDYFVWSE